MDAKIKSVGAITEIVRHAKRHGKKIVTTNGCFDLLHVGHVRNLQYAKSLGDILIVGINSDNSVRKNKGPLRPIVPEKERAEMIAALKPVDCVFIFGDETPISWLKRIRPHIHVKGADRKLNQIIERGTLKQIGAKLVLAPHYKGKSTTLVIKKYAKTLKTT